MREIKFRVRYRAWADHYETLRLWIGTIEELLLVSAAWRQNNVSIEGFDEFTGLKDKNGKDIYEGDICRYETEDGTGVKAKVIFQDGEEAESCFTGFGMKVITTFEHEIDIDDQPIDGWHGELEVIGNIHKNPELLK